MLRLIAQCARRYPTGMSYLLPFLFLIGCQENGKQINPLSKSFFPNEIGNQWVYSVYDSTKLTQYDVTITITSTDFINNRKVNVWTIEYPGRTETNFVSVDNDTINFWGSDRITVEHTYLLPFSIGNRWTGSWIGDQYNIIGQQSITVGGQTFQNAYNIKEFATSPNFRRTKDEWFVPYLGMVKRYRFEYDFSLPDDKVWTLKSRKL